ncbi:T9SS type A sorting domain-containing protein [Flavobacterium sp. 25HG05S-40]|uniref:T9SS type A sorting domain-containing protein n=1 Tax=Flavobacterium sp. 25HG05S-40 TaxID=3458682 RepID=UPI004044A72B
MKSNFLFSSLVFFTVSLQAQIVNIPDANFKARLLMASSSSGIAINSSNNPFKIDSNNNGEIEVSEALLVYKLNLNSYNFSQTSYISDLTGLAAFQNLRVLNCSKNNLTQINLLPLTFLEELGASYNAITSLDISNLTHFKKLLAHTNQINTITQNNNSSLENIWLSNNVLTSFDLSVFPALKWVSCDNNQLTSINLSGLTLIDEVECGNNLLTSLNLDGLTTLRILGCGGNQISSLNVSSLPTLNMLRCGFNPINGININGLSSLGLLNVDNTLLTSLDASQSGVQQLFASGCANLQTINVRNGVYSYSDPDLLYFAFNIYDNPNLISICTDDGEQNQLVYRDYNTSGNVVVYNGSNCDIPVQVNMSVTDADTIAVKLFPNPTASILNIEIPETAVLNRIVISTLLGQTVMTLEGPKTIDVSSLTKGTYFVNVETDTGKATQKLIKL